MIDTPHGNIFKLLTNDMIRVVTYGTIWEIELPMVHLILPVFVFLVRQTYRAMLKKTLLVSTFHK